MSAAPGRPRPTEYAEYYHRYISLVPDGDVLEILARQIGESRALLGAVPPDRESWAYAPGKWSIREAVGHLVDAERVFTGRTLWIARAPSIPLPSMEQDAWVAASGAGGRSLADLLDEWEAVRGAGLALFRGLGPRVWEQVGEASGVRFTLRAFPWIIAGHELHHRSVFRERYGLTGPA